MHSFDLVVVGAGGGPLETNLSAYLVKTQGASWQDGIVALEAGSGMGALAGLLERKPALFADLTSVPNASRPIRVAARIYSYITTFLITHAHLDHISGLVISAGSLDGPRKTIAATRQVLADIETVFNDRIWPRLASWDDRAGDKIYRYHTLNTTPDYYAVGPNISVRVMPISHGTCSSKHRPVYESSAFFVRNDVTAHEFLFFGDVDPDSIASSPPTRAVWRVAATMIPDGRLRTIFLECSWPAGRAEQELYGHLSPKYVLQELQALATEVVRAKGGPVRRSQTNSLPPSPRLPTFRRKSRATAPHVPQILSRDELRGALSGVRLFIIHCKEPLDASDNDLPIREVIATQIRGLVDPEELGIEIIAAEQGMRLQI